MVGKVRPPTNPDRIKIYLKPPAKYEQVAILNTDSNLSISFSNQAKVDVAIQRAKEEAAKLGANGILLNSVGEAGSVPAVGGSTFPPGNPVTDSAIGATQGGMVKTFSGLAIFVIEE